MANGNPIPDKGRNQSACSHIAMIVYIYILIQVTYVNNIFISAGHKCEAGYTFSFRGDGGYIIVATGDTLPFNRERVVYKLVIWVRTGKGQVTTCDREEDPLNRVHTTQSACNAFVLQCRPPKGSF